MATELFIQKKYKYAPLRFVQDKHYVVSSSSHWAPGIYNNKEGLLVETIIGNTTDDKISLYLNPLSSSSLQWLLKFSVTFIDENNSSNAVTFNSGNDSVTYNNNGFYSFDFGTGQPDENFSFTASTAVFISAVEMVPNFPRYRSVSLPETEVVKLSTSLKDIREPLKGGTTFSKSFKLPFSSNSHYVFDNFGFNDSFYDDVTTLEYDAQISVDGIGLMAGSLYIDKILTDNVGDKFYSLVFTGINTSFFNQLKQIPLYLLDTATFESQTAAHIKNNIVKYNGLLAKAAGYKHTYGLMEMGEDLKALKTKPALTQDLPVLNKNGLMADSFTPALWNWYVFERIHELIGYSVEGTILDDPTFNNLVLPMNRKNWWEKAPTVSIEDDVVFEGLSIDNPSFATGYIYYQQYTAEANLFNPLFSDSQPTKGSFRTVGGKYSRYNGLAGLGTVRQDFDFSNLTINTYHQLDPDYYHSHPHYKLRLYVAQQKGLHTTNDFEYILLDTVDFDANGTTQVSFNAANTNRTTMHSYKTNAANQTYFYVTWEFYNDTNGEANSNHQVTFSIANGSDVSTEVTSDSQGSFSKARFDRFLGAQVGTFLLNKNKTAYEYLEDMIKMFNLVVDINTTTKTITYNTWGEFSDEIINLSDYLILNKNRKIDLFSTNVPLTYNLKFQLDESDWQTSDWLMGGNENPTEMLASYGHSSSSPEFLTVNSNFYFNTTFDDYDSVSILSNFGIYTNPTTEAKSKSNRINYNWDKGFYAFMNSEDLQDDLKLYSEDLSSEYLLGRWPLLSYFQNADGIAQSFKNVNQSDIPDDNTSSNLFLAFWNPILYQITKNGTKLHTEYFYLPADIYSTIKLTGKFRIENELFFINKISNWYPNGPTKIELFKIWNDTLPDSVAP